MFSSIKQKDVVSNARYLLPRNRCYVLIKNIEIIMVVLLILSMLWYILNLFFTKFWFPINELVGKFVATKLKSIFWLYMLEIIS